MFNGHGKLLYYPSWWLIVKVNEDVCRYYRNLIHFQYRSLRLNPSKHGAHITVIAGKYEQPDDEHKPLWSKYEGERIEFEYSPEIETNNEYFWAKVECKRIEEIRAELGLPPKIKHPWHLTIGNIIK
jgi:hypothetical protein